MNSKFKSVEIAGFDKVESVEVAGFDGSDQIGSVGPQWMQVEMDGGVQNDSVFGAVLANLLTLGFVSKLTAIPTSHV